MFYDKKKKEEEEKTMHEEAESPTVSEKVKRNMQILFEFTME